MKSLLSFIVIGFVYLLPLTPLAAPQAVAREAFLAASAPARSVSVSPAERQAAVSVSERSTSIGLAAQPQSTTQLQINGDFESGSWSPWQIFGAPTRPIPTATTSCWGCGINRARPTITVQLLSFVQACRRRVF